MSHAGKKSRRAKRAEGQRPRCALGGGSASLKRWCAWCPELGLLLETAHESRFGVRQNVRRQLYWADKRSWQEIAAEDQWHEVEVTASFSLPNGASETRRHENPKTL